MADGAPIPRDDWRASVERRLAALEACLAPSQTGFGPLDSRSLCPTCQGRIPCTTERCPMRQQLTTQGTPA